MNGFLLFHLRPLLVRKTRALLSVIGIGAGVALAVAVLGLVGSIRATAARLAAVGPADAVEIDAPGGAGMPAVIGTDVAATAGAGRLIPLVRSQVAIGGWTALLIGAPGDAVQLDPTLARHIDVARAPSAAGSGDGLLVSRAFATTLRVSPTSSLGVYGADGRTRPATVAGEITGGSLAHLYGGRAVVTTLAAAQELAGRGPTVDVIYAYPRRGTTVAQLASRLTDRLSGRAVITSRARRVQQAQAAVAGLVFGFLALAFTAMVVGGFLVFNTMHMAAVERRRDLATLTVLGAERRVLIVGALTEAGLLGALGGLIGAVAGLAGAHLLVAKIPAVLAQVVGAPITVSVPATAPLLAAVGGIVVAVIAGIGPARTAAGANPLSVMRRLPGGLADQTARPAVFSAVGAGVAALIGAGTWVKAGFASPGVLGLGVALLLATFALTTPACRLTRNVAGALGGPGRLAAAALTRSARRVWATAAAVATTMMLVLAFTGVVANLTTSSRSSLHSASGDSLFAVAASGSRLPPVQLPATWRAQIAALRGVTRVDAFSYTFTQLRNRQVLLLGVDGDAGIPPFRLAPDAARRTVLGGGGMIVTRQFSRALGVRLGQRVTLVTPTGPHTLRITAVTNTLSASENGTATISHQLLADWYHLSGYGGYEIRHSPSTDITALTADIRQLTPAVPLPLSVETGDQVVGDVLRSLAQLSTLIYATVALVVVIAGIALLNTVISSISDRRRELGVLRALGSSRAQLGRIVAAEAIAIACTGALVGIPAGLMLHGFDVAFLSRSLPYPMHYQLHPVGILYAVIGVTAITLLGAIAPARRAGHDRIIDALAYE